MTKYKAVIKLAPLKSLVITADSKSAAKEELLDKLTQGWFSLDMSDVEEYWIERIDDV